MGHGGRPKAQLELTTEERLTLERLATMRKIRRGAHMSVRALDKDIRDWIAAWNENPRPYVWVKTADQILASLARYCERVSAVAPAPEEK